MEKSCAFTGHRILTEKPDINLLEKVIVNLIKSGVKNFYCGMAKGFDLIAAECVLRLKKYFDITLCACVPYERQQEYYSKNDVWRYEKILGACDKKVVFGKDYYKGCMHERDRFLVDNSDVLICYLRKSYGGTYYTVSYAKKKNVKIIEL